MCVRFLWRGIDMRIPLTVALFCIMYPFGVYGQYLEKGPGDDQIKLHDQRRVGFYNWAAAVSNNGTHARACGASFCWLPLRQDQCCLAEFPAGTGIGAIAASALWISVLKDSTGSDPETRYSISQTSYADATDPAFIGDWGPGRITNSNVPFNNLTFENFLANDNRVYVIDTSRSGPDWISWPQHDGAPVDSQGNPILISQEDSWAVYNDANLNLHVPGWNSALSGIGVNVQQSTHEFYQAQNAVVLRYKIVNHTNVAYDSAYVSIWSDVELGNITDDRMGTDTVRNMVYCYDNGPRVVGYKLLYASGNQSDKSRLGGSASIPAGNQVLADTMAYFYPQGLDPDGTLRLVSEGQVEEDGSRFVFPGDPVTGQGLLSPGMDLALIATAGPFKLHPGLESDVIFTLLGGQGSTRNDAILDLRRSADSLQFIFENYIDFLLGIDSVIASKPIAGFGVTETDVLTQDPVKFNDYSLADPNGTTWSWDLDGDGLIDSNDKNPAWTYSQAGLQTITQIVEHSGLADTLTLEDYIIVRGRLPIPFSDNFDSSPDPYILNWINTTTHVSDQSSNPPSPPFALALDAHPDGPEMITSSLFDLAGYADSSIVLSYWYQPQGDAGGGGRPEPDDSLIVEIKNNLGQWIVGKAYPGEAMFEFRQDGICLDSVEAGPGATFFWDRFQFRFRGTSTPASGSLHKDVWFIDDVVLGSQMCIVGIDDNEFNVPKIFKIHQNFPNPFNPSTTIRYDLPKAVKVSLKIYNVLGQEIKTLVNHKQTAGFKSVDWDGRSNAGHPVSSGVYVYRIEAGSFVKSKKMILLR